MFDAAPKVWSVGSLCRAIADALEARFNPVCVRGELAGFARAASGHCYFTLKDASGQLRCAMFKRAAQMLDFSPRDGDLVELRGRLDLYQPRGDLQLIVEHMAQAGQGALFEQFLQRKARLEALGLFDAQRKRPLPVMPRAIGVVTSLGAAAWHDVVTALKRRVPHIPVCIAPALVQGAQAPASLQEALTQLYRLHAAAQASAGGQGAVASARPVIDVILLVRGGGSLDDLWAFNDEALVHTIAQSPVPVVSGVGHETDFTLADFVADLRAPTPTAAAELVAQPQAVWRGALDVLAARSERALTQTLDAHAQRLDAAAQRLGRPSSLVASQRQGLQGLAYRLARAAQSACSARQARLAQLAAQLPRALQTQQQAQTERVARAGLKLGLLDPALVLERGYAWLTDAQGQMLSRVQQAQPGQTLHARLQDGLLAVQVQTVHSAAPDSGELRLAEPAVKPL